MSILLRFVNCEFIIGTRLEIAKGLISLKDMSNKNLIYGL